MVDHEFICTLRQLDGNNPRKGKLMMQSVLSILQLYSVIDDIDSLSSLYLFILEPPETMNPLAKRRLF